MTEPEPGYTTTEFWMTLAAALIGVLVAFHVVVFTDAQRQSVLGLVAIVAPVVAYVLSRGIRKVGK